MAGIEQQQQQQRQWRRSAQTGTGAVARVSAVAAQRQRAPSRTKLSQHVVVVVGSRACQIDGHTMPDAAGDSARAHRHQQAGNVHAAHHARRVAAAGQPPALHPHHGPHLRKDTVPFIANHAQTAPFKKAFFSLPSLPKKKTRESHLPFHLLLLLLVFACRLSIARRRFPLEWQHKVIVKKAKFIDF